MTVTREENLDPSDMLTVNGLDFPSQEAGRTGDGHIVTERREGPTARIVTRSPRTRRKPQPIPAVIIDKSALFRAGLTHILSGSKFRVAAECSTLHDLPEQALGSAGCVALIGLDSNVEMVLSRITTLKQKHAGLRVIVLSEQFHAERFLAAIGAGADGYLLRNEISPNAVLKSLELVLVEGVVVPHGFAKLLNNQPELQVHAATEIERLEPIPTSIELQVEPENVSARSPGETVHNSFFGRLSDREHVILMHLTHGASNKHIARELNIAEATVKVHVKSLLRKIRVNNRTQAAMWAINHVGPIARQNPRRLN